MKEVENIHAVENKKREYSHLIYAIALRAARGCRRLAFRLRSIGPDKVGERGGEGEQGDTTSNKRVDNEN